MGISNLALQKERAALGPQENINIRIPVGIINESDVLAEHFGVTRAFVLREMMIEGFNKVMTEWDWAHENAQEGKKK